MHRTITKTCIRRSVVVTPLPYGTPAETLLPSIKRRICVCCSCVFLFPSTNAFHKKHTPYVIIVLPNQKGQDGLLFHPALYITRNPLNCLSYGDILLPDRADPRYCFPLPDLPDLRRHTLAAEAHHQNRAN